jgi:hypothetical protein
MVLFSLLIFTVIISVLIYYLFLSEIIDNLLYSVSKEPPVARNYIPKIGFALKFIKDPYNFLQWLHRKYGDRVTVYFLSRRHIFFNDQATFVNRISKDPAFTLDFIDNMAHLIGGIRWQCIQN